MKLLWGSFVVPLTVKSGKISIAQCEYKCNKCGHRFRVKGYWGVRFGFYKKRQLLKCPKCKKPTWCKVDDN